MTAGKRSVGWPPTRWIDDFKQSLKAAENKRPRTVDFVTPYKRPMSSSGLKSVEVTMITNSVFLILVLLTFRRKPEQKKCRQI
ncbi:jg7577 [Pararge aegeria aegeria]|uniref:Jg7577 protein n=1 Tax=Pararge aegeria aegeria TaxID=348720 RepID=A0A8S4S6G6_9NEOP|nr:jg7577 [Pararge aegeria aegeria]